MKKIKKLIVIALATTMLLGATLTVHAAPYYPFYPSNGRCINSTCQATLISNNNGAYYCPGCRAIYDPLGN